MDCMHTLCIYACAYIIVIIELENNVVRLLEQERLRCGLFARASNHHHFVSICHSPEWHYVSRGNQSLQRWAVLFIRMQRILITNKHTHTHTH